MGYMTLNTENQFKFKCPIFNAETKMASCMKLRNLVWRGRNPEKRKGCQACMAAGKCPAADIAQKMAMSSARNPRPDDYGSTNPILGKLRKDVLERIRPVMVMSGTLIQHGLSSAEVNLIETSNARIDAMMRSAPTAKSAKATLLSKPRAAKKTEAAGKITSEIEKAAATGDLSAAL